MTATGVASSRSLVDRLVAVRHPLDGEPVEDRIADRLPVEIRRRGRPGRPSPVTSSPKKPSMPSRRISGRAPIAARDDRCPAGQRLDGDEAERLRPRAGHQRGIAFGEELVALGLVELAEELDRRAGRLERPAGTRCRSSRAPRPSARPWPRSAAVGRSPLRSRWPRRCPSRARPGRRSTARRCAASPNGARSGAARCGRRRPTGRRGGSAAWLSLIATRPRGGSTQQRVSPGQVEPAVERRRRPGPATPARAAGSPTRDGCG